MEHNKEKQNDEIEIDLRQVAIQILDKIVIIILAGIIGALAMLIYSKVFAKPVYTSTTNLYVISRQNDTTTTYSDVQTSTLLVKDFKVLVTSRTVTEQVISELGLDMTATQLANSVTVAAQSDTRVLEISVDNTDPYLAKSIADKLADVSSEFISSIMQIEKISTIDKAEVAAYPTSPNTTKNVLIGGAIGVILALAIVIIRMLMDDTVKNSDDIERYFGISTLALIPLSEQLDDSKYNSRGKRKKKHSSHSSQSASSAGRKQGDN